MMSKLTKNGISTTTENDTFAYEKYFSSLLGGYRYHWDYRDKNGQLFSGVAKSYQEAVAEARRHGYQGS